MLSKIITNRLSDVLPFIVGLSQTCSVICRSISDNVHLLRNIFDYVEQKQFPACFINLDQEKAYDGVDWGYMFNVLESFGFSSSFISWISVLYKDVTSSVIFNGHMSETFNLQRSVRQGCSPSFISWIKVLYKDVASSVIVNGFISKDFNLQRSVRQGCSLLPLLYILCLERLAFKIQNDINSKGIVIPGGGNFHVKISLYADDNTSILTDNMSIKISLLMSTPFRSYLGLKLIMINIVECFWVSGKEGKITLLVLLGLKIVNFYGISLVIIYPLMIYGIRCF